MASSLGLRRSEVRIPDSSGHEPVRWNYWHSGSAAPENLVVLHGLGGDHTGLYEMLAELRGVNVYAPDLPGYGESEPLRVPHTLENYAAAVEALRAALALDDFHLVGHSLGASIAMLYAATYGFGLKSLCLLNPVSAAEGGTAALGRFYYRIGAFLPDGLRRLWLASRPAVYLADIVIIRTKDAARRRQILAQDYENYRRASTRAMVESFLSYYDTPFADHARKVGTEALLITGDKDGIAPPDSVARLHAAMPSSQLEIVAGGGHLLPLEQPADIAAILNDFLATAR
jgi:pimeloyl-ACP methyl ester carboxylesterase